MKKNFEKLLRALKEIEESEEIKFKEYLTNGFQSELPEIIKYAKEKADEALRTNGQVDFNKAFELERYGYKVFRGDYDSYGWVTGCIKTKKGIIVFG